MSKRSPLAWLVVLGVCQGLAYAGEWPQFLGPSRTGVAQGEKLMDAWPASGPRELWKISVGQGFAGVAIRDDLVHLLDREGDEADVLRVFELKTGKELWTARYEAKGRFSHGGSRSTPTVDDQFIYTVGSLGHLNAFDRKTHQVAWSVHLNEKYEKAAPQWGFAQSPLVHGDLVIATPLHDNSPGLVAFDKKTGKVVWESEAFGGDYYVSPMAMKIAGREGILQLANKHLVFVDPKTGKTIWKYSGYNKCSWPIPAPTLLPDGKRLFITGGYGAGSVMIEVTPSGSGFNVKELYRMKEGSQLHPAILVDGKLYANLNENANLKKGAMDRGGFACIDPDSGKVIWNTGESPNFNRGNFIFADGKFIFLEGSTGELFLIKPDAKAYKQLSKFAALPQKKNNEVWAPLALSDGLLLARDQNTLKCFAIGK